MACRKWPKQTCRNGAPEDTHEQIQQPEEAEFLTGPAAKETLSTKAEHIRYQHRNIILAPHTAIFSCDWSRRRRVCPGSPPRRSATLPDNRRKWFGARNDDYRWRPTLRFNIFRMPIIIGNLNLAMNGMLGNKRCINNLLAMTPLVLPSSSLAWTWLWMILKEYHGIILQGATHSHPQILFLVWVSTSLT